MSALKIGIGIGSTVYGAYCYHQERKTEALIAAAVGVFFIGLEIDNLDRFKRFRAELLPKQPRLSDCLYEYFFE